MTIDDADIGDIIEYEGKNHQVYGKCFDFYWDGKPCGDVFLFQTNDYGPTTMFYVKCGKCKLVKKNDQQVKTEKDCACDIIALMQVGCKCGSFKRNT